MLDALMFLLYLDQGLIKDLHSTVIEGFVESETVRFSIDTSNNNRFKLGIKDKKEKEGVFNLTDDTEALEVKECYTMKSIELENHMDAEYASEDRRANRKDIEHKKIYFSAGLDYSSSCVFFHHVWNKMKQMGITKSIAEVLSSIDSYCCQGEFVEFYGEITSISITSYIQKIIDIIEAYSAETLNEILVKAEYKGDKNFGIIYRMLKKLHIELQSGGTEDIIFKAKNHIILLNVCSREFDARHLHMYDNCACKCKVWGKVCKVIDKDDGINLLRKTGHSMYYESLLHSFEPYFDCLRNNGVILPSRPALEIRGPSLLIKPISIHM